MFGFRETFFGIVSGICWFALTVWVGGLFYIPWRSAEKVQWWRWGCLIIAVLMFAAGMAFVVSR